jgi:hypothetical protein
MYFHGSSTEMASLSLLRSRPAAAHEGNCAIQLRPDSATRFDVIKDDEAAPLRAESHRVSHGPSRIC